MKSSSKPTNDQVDRAVALLNRPENLRRFFEQLTNENWLEPLRSRGFFAKELIPGRESLEGTRSFRFRPWPQSTYLLNVAAKAPKEVAEIIVDLATTENVWVQQDFLEAALHMPPHEAKLIARVAQSWLRSGIPTLVPEKAAKLVEMLIDEEPAAAFQLAEAFLAVWLPKVERKTDSKTGISFPIHLEARSFVDTWHYYRFLTAEFRSLVNKHAAEAVGLLAKVLKGVLKLEERWSNQRTDDYSWIWYENLEADSFVETSPRNALVAGLRDAIKVAATSGTHGQKAILDLLASQGCTIFSRFYLYSLSRCPADQLDRVDEALRDSRLYGQAGMGPELRRLLRAAFGMIPAGTRAEVMKIIDRGPELSNYRAWHKQETGSEPDDETCARVADQWRLPYLYALLDFLPAEKQREVRAAFKDEGWDVSTGERAGPRAAAVGPRSPLTADQMRGMGPAGVRAFLADWDPGPPSFFDRFSPEGLGRVLSTVVSEQAGAYAAAADTFRFENEPTYVRALIEGFADAVTKGIGVDWANILQFCGWAVSQPRSRGFDAGEFFFRDPHWGWTRRSVIILLERGFAGEPPIPEEFSSRVWDLLSVLANDPDPAASDQWEYEKSNTDPTTHAMNTVRGEALIAVVKYLEWRTRTIRGKGLKPTLSDMPEVLPVLEAKLDPQQEQSLAVRSVFGQALPILAYLDLQWVQSHVEVLFNPGEHYSPLGQVVWESYLVDSRLRADLFAVLEQRYTIAVRQPPAKPMYTFRTPQQALAEHVMTAFWWGLSDLESPDTLASLFFQESADEWRAHAVSFLERSMRNQAPPDAAVRQRLRHLWETRVLAAEQGNAAGQDKELVEFTPWAAIEWFDTEWRLEMLRRTLRLTRGRGDLLHLVAQHLAAVSQAFPLQVLRCLQAGLDAEDETALYHWRIVAPKVLSNAFGSADPAVRELARSIGNSLAEGGFHEGTRPSAG